jgi:hypothetical protein
VLCVAKVKPQSVAKTVHALIHVGSAVAAEIALDVTNDVTASPMVLELQVEAGVLCGGAEFSDVTLRSVAERYSAEIGGDVALCIRGSKYILEIDETSRG